MITAAQLAEAYALNTRIIQMQTDDLTQADSLIQTPYHVNSLNWTLGHIAVHRDKVLALLEHEPLLSSSETERYGRGSEPVTGEDAGTLPLELLVGIIDRGQEIISQRLPKLTPEELERELPLGKTTTTLAARLHWYYFHDTYHTGQTELLRQIAGKNDQIIK